MTAPPCPAICRRAPGEVAEWLKAADCKSARASVRWFESSPLHHISSSYLQAITCQRYLLRADSHVVLPCDIPARGVVRYDRKGEGCVNDRQQDKAYSNRDSGEFLVRRLSDGQLEVLQLVDQHMNSKEIGARLGISSHTVDQRIRGAIKVLGVSRRQEAARLVGRASPYQPIDTSSAAYRRWPNPRRW